MRETTIDLIASGGVASGTSLAPLNGLLKAIHADHSGGGAGTTDLTITVGGSVPRTIMTKADSADDGWFYPCVQRTDESGSPIAGAFTDVFLNDYLTASLDQANEGQTCSVAVIYDNLR